jgi:hypothetical protein
MKNIYKVVLCIAICFALTLTTKAQFTQIGATYYYNTNLGAGGFVQGINVGTY